MAQEVLQDAFRTDLRPLLAESRLREGAALDPVHAYREAGVRAQLIRERGEKTVSTGL
jgi:L-rhamnose isomerase/sugar isomerase